LTGGPSSTSSITGSPLVLAIEISNPSARGDGSPGVALLTTSGEPVGAEPLGADARHDDDLMPAIDRLFTKTGRAPADIERVAVSVGPGGFTGLRVAVVTAKLLAHAAGAQTVAARVLAPVTHARRQRSPAPQSAALPQGAAHRRAKRQSPLVQSLPVAQGAPRSPAPIGGAHSSAIGPSPASTQRFAHGSVSQQSASDRQVPGLGSGGHSAGPSSPQPSAAIKARVSCARRAMRAPGVVARPGSRPPEASSPGRGP